MKEKQSVARKSHFWSRLLGLLITFAIIIVMVFGGVKNLLVELSAVHEALAASQYELGMAQNELNTTTRELDATQSELSGKSLALQQSARQLDDAGNLIVALASEREHLKHRWGQSQSALAQRNQQLMATDDKLRAAEAELERHRQQPQWSMIVTTERQLNLSQRERYGASHVRMAIASDAGAMYYEGWEAQHEIEKHLSYAERTQVVWTKTAPGQDVLTCLEDEARGCATIVGARVYAAHMEAYSYRSQYSSMALALMK